MSNLVYESSRGYDLIPVADQLLKNRQIFLEGGISPETVNETIRNLLILNDQDKQKPVTIFVSSPGGEVNSGLALFDTIQLLECPVITVCLGLAASMGAVIFLAGTERLITKNSKLMIHSPAFGKNHDIAYMKPNEIKTELDDLNEAKERVDKIISERTKIPLKEIKKLTEKDSFFTAEEAVKKGFATGFYDKLCNGGDAI